MSNKKALAVSVCLGTFLLLAHASWSATTRFKPAQSYPSGNGFAIAVADVNADGRPDILVGDEDSTAAGIVSVLLGNGDGTFQAAQSYVTGGHQITAIAVADVNSDGKLDVVVSQFEGVAVLFGNGNGSFEAPQTYPINSAFGASGIAVADVNRDGKPDLLVSLECFPTSPYCGPGGAGVLLGEGNGMFGTLQAYSSGGFYPSSIAVADVNHDGNLDLILDNEGNSLGSGKGSAGILLGNGDGTFQAAQKYETGGFNGGSLAVGDLNGDGNPDIIIAHNCANPACNESTVGVLLGNGDGTFKDVKVYFNTGGYSAQSVVVVDVTGDGIPDVVVANTCDNQFCSQGRVKLLVGNGDGTLTPVAPNFSSGGQSAWQIAAADVNGDGIPDLFVTNGCDLLCDRGGIVSVLLSLSPTATSFSSSLNPSVYGQAVTLTATVKPVGTIPATGRVNFLSGTRRIGSATLNASGVATFTKSNLNADSYPLVAVYAGDPNYLASTSAALIQVVQQATSAAAIVSSQNPSTLGQAVTFTAAITSPTAKPNEPVTFTTGTTVLGTVQLSGGKAKLTTSSLPLGAAVVTVTYQGDSNISGSSASITQTVQQ
jgi:hypothetical protein